MGDGDSTSVSGGGRGGGRGRGFQRGRYPWRGSYVWKRGNGRGRGRGGGNNEIEGGGVGGDGVEQEGEGNFRRGGGRGTNGYNNYNGNYKRKGNDGHDDGRSGGGSDHSENNPPKKKRREDPLQTIKANVIKQWRKLLPGYDLYYCDRPPQISDVDDKMKVVSAFLKKANVIQKEAKRNKNFGWEDCYLLINTDDLRMDTAFSKAWPDFDTQLSNEADEVIKLWSCTAHKAVLEIVMADEPKLEDNSINEQNTSRSNIYVQVGLFRAAPLTSLVSIKSENLHKFVSIRGAIIKSGNVHTFFQRMTFRCKMCFTQFTMEQPGGNLTLPQACRAPDPCSNTFLFETLDSSPSTVMVDYRHIKLQDVLHCDIEKGSVPRTIDCILYGNLVNQCCTGDAVTISGVVKRHVDTAFSVHSGDRSLHEIYIEVSAIKQHKESERTMGGHLFSFTDKDYYAVSAIHSTPNLFRFLVASLCPSIFGHELVKAGLLLCLFGGDPRSQEPVGRRSDINMLMVGDPGIGKSQMLKIVSEVSPRAVYVCGTGSTVAGLTVTLVKDGDDFSLEAGALVMADNGVCCIDEFDKMSKQHAALLEAMEQQSVSVAKSGVFRTLPARTTVIAAANPVGGHYDRTRTVSENIKINPALMSRFDLIFILLDQPHEESDKLMVNHKKKHTGGAGRSCHKVSIGGKSEVQENQQAQERQTLMEKLRIPPGSVLDFLPHPLLRKYIAYAKQYVRPKLTPEAKSVLKDYYLKLRTSRRGYDTTPVTARQLESLVRLTEARAKLELREEATEEDARDIMDLFEFSLSSALDNEVQAVSALSESVILSTSQSGSRSKSVISQAKKLLATVQEYAQKQCKNLFSASELKEIAAALGFKDKISSLIATLNNEGCLLKKGGSTYQLQSMDY